MNEFRNYIYVTLKLEDSHIIFVSFRIKESLFLVQIKCMCILNELTDRGAFERPFY